MINKCGLGKVKLMGYNLPKNISFGVKSYKKDRVGTKDCIINLK